MKLFQAPNLTGRLVLKYLSSASFQADHKVLSSSEHSERQATKEPEPVINGSGCDVIVLTTGSTAQCRVCYVSCSSDALTDHELNHLEAELVETVKKLAAKSKSEFWTSGSLRCNVCGVKSSGPPDKQWREIARHMGRSHGTLIKFNWPYF